MLRDIKLHVIWVEFHSYEAVAAGTLFRVASGRSKDFAVSGGGMNEIIENAPRLRSRRHAAVEDSGSGSEDTEADEAGWEDILATMGDGEGDGVEVTDDERDTVLPDPLVECFTRSRRCVKRPRRD